MYSSAAPARSRDLGKTVAEPVGSASSARAYWLESAGLRAALANGPRGAEYFAAIDALSPGLQSAWIDHGSASGARVGDNWWLRVDGQPAARCETLLVTAQHSFTRVFPLAKDSWLDASLLGHRVEHDHDYSFRIFAVAKLRLD